MGLPQAVNCLTEAGMKEETAVLYNNLAATYIQRGRPVAALHYCEQAIKVLPLSHLHTSQQPL